MANSGKKLTIQGKWRMDSLDGGIRIVKPAPKRPAKQPKKSK